MGTEHNAGVSEAVQKMLMWSVAKAVEEAGGCRVCMWKLINAWRTDVMRSK